MLVFALKSIVSIVLMLQETFVQHWIEPIFHTDDGALFLTPMIRSDRIDEARNACRVELPEQVTFESYSGYLTVDEFHRSNLFFWFIPAMNGTADAPVILWLDGGPGDPSLYGLFEGTGPFFVTKSGKLRLRKKTWVSTHSMLYVDNPVGTGFSFTDDSGYNTDETGVARNMYEALLQFFTLFPEYQKNDFYIAGQSYAGKYVPAVSYAIHQKNPNASIKINLRGMAIGNGYVDSIQQAVYGETLYAFGVIDEMGKRKFEEMELLARKQIEDGDYTAAFYTDCRMTFDEDSLFNNLTDLPSLYNVLADTDDTEQYWRIYVLNPATRAALHVGERQLNSGSIVGQYLRNDVMHSVSPWLGALLDTGLYRVLLYSGQFDLIVPYSGTMNMVRALPWSGAERFKDATRTIWRVRNSEKNTAEVAGYANSFGPLTVLLVRNAGHGVIADQPVWAHEMINLFTSGRPFH